MNDSAQACWSHLLSAHGVADVADMQAGQRRWAPGRSCRPAPCRRCFRAAAGSRKSAHALDPIALDVEYAHVHLPGHGEASVAAWVCLVAPYSAQPLLKTYCRHPLLNGHEQLPAVNQAKASGAGGASKGHQLRGIGGVRLKALQGAPSLSQVADQVRELWHGRLLVGHGVAKDLKALGVDVELSDCSNDTTGSASSGVYYDTITFPEFQSKGGTAYSLKRLAKERLGQNIHAPGALHDPEVDARVVLRLYMEVVRPTLLSSSYDDLVQHYEQQFLAQAMARQGKPQDEQASPEA